MVDSRFMTRTYPPNEADEKRGTEMTPFADQFTTANISRAGNEYCCFDFSEAEYPKLQLYKICKMNA
uniref:Uncharacterized protein n=1 Tax=Setaria digitata TaxID=48799 RepID=A0A915Q2M9_9BILA